MTTQEICITAQITLEVPIELSKEEIINLFHGRPVEVFDRTENSYTGILEIIDIEEEAQIYGNED